jgi:hypothetical protein
MVKIRRAMASLSMVVTISSTCAVSEDSFRQRNLIDGDGGLKRWKWLVQVGAPVAQTFIWTESHEDQ